MRFGRARLSALRRGFPRAALRLHAIRSRPRVTPAGGAGVTRSSLTPKPSTWHPDRNVEGVVTRTARERRVWRRPQEPHSLPPNRSTLAKGIPQERAARLRNDRATIVKFGAPRVAEALILREFLFRIVAAGVNLGGALGYDSRERVALALMSVAICGIRLRGSSRISLRSSGLRSLRLSALRARGS
jgi:hypothetical protein